MLVTTRARAETLETRSRSSFAALGTKRRGRYRPRTVAALLFHVFQRWRKHLARQMRLRRPAKAKGRRWPAPLAIKKGRSPGLVSTPACAGKFPLPSLDPVRALIGFPASCQPLVKAFPRADENNDADRVFFNDVIHGPVFGPRCGD